MNEGTVRRRSFFWPWMIAGVLLALTITPVLGVSAPAAPSELDVEKFAAYFESQVTAHRFAGLSVAITDGDQIVYTGNFGSAGDGRPMTSQTAFPIASASKSFAALATLQLAEQGMIDLEAPVQKYLPWWQIADPQASAMITVRHLLTQTSGLGEDGYESDLRPESSLEEAVRDLKRARLVHPVGTTFDYFDSNYFTLSLIVQILSAKPYATYLQENIFQPLGMTHSTNIQVAVDRSNIARGSDPLFTIPVSVPEVIDQSYEVGCCGIVTTAEDMAHYLIAQLKGGQYGGRQVLSAAGIQSLHAPQPAEGFPFSAPINYTGYGMGWFRRDTAGTYVLEAPGTHRSYEADVLLLPEQGYGVVLLYNQGGLLTTLFGRQLIDGLVNLLTGSPVPGSLVSLGTVSLVLAVVAVVTIGLQIRALLAVRRWGLEMQGARPWRRVLGAAWPFLLAAVLLAVILQLKTMFAWPWLDFVMWMPDIVGWLLLLLGLSLLLGVRRAWLAVLGNRRDPSALERVAGHRGLSAGKVF